MQGVKQLNKIHAVVEISLAYERLIKDLYPTYEAGFHTIYDTFNFLEDLNAVAARLIEETPIEGDDGEEQKELVLDGFLENTHSLRRGNESKSEFYARFFAFNPNLAADLTLEDKIDITFKLALIDIQLSCTLRELEAIGVKFNVFKADHIIDCINVIWDYDVSVLVNAYTSDPEKDPISLRESLITLYKAMNGLEE
ncbi:hypothetical protein ABIC37_005419 [Priestia megaterium]|uniref:hypothetical protein n=1 Tax=Priestia megaterium TaxID=1404 RepID=UPI00339AAFC7